MNTGFWKKIAPLLLLLILACCVCPMTVSATEATEKHSYENGVCANCGEVTTLKGKTISILGDSISTYRSVSNNKVANATLKRNKSYYKRGRYGVYLKDTWWQQVIDQMGMKLLVNNSSSGSSIFKARVGNAGAYIDRCVQLHTSAGEEPDIIAVYLGTNDLLGNSNEIGTAADIQYDKLIVKTKKGYRYTKPKTVCEAYAILLHKMTQRYPNAEIYCFTLLPRKNPSKTRVRRMERFHRSVEQIADRYGAYIVDLYNDSGIESGADFKHYIADNSLHPGPFGMDAIAGCFTSALLKNSRFVSGKVCDIRYDLSGAIVDQGTASAVLKGSSFSCSLTAFKQHKLSVKVTMGGKNITGKCYKDGKITIDNVKGNICIKATCYDHNYVSAVTAPTKTKKGYTTNTCVCGNRCVSEYIGAPGEHAYENGICSDCGAALPGSLVIWQPVNDKAALGERYAVKVNAVGKGLKYQWYYRNAGSKTWRKSSVCDSTYDGTMTKARANREVYCVVTDAAGNQIKTKTAKLVAVKK